MHESSLDGGPTPTPPALPSKPRPGSVLGLQILLCLMLAGLGWFITQLMPYFLNQDSFYDETRKLTYTCLAFLVEFLTFLAVSLRIRNADALGLLSLLVHGVLFVFTAIAGALLMALGGDLTFQYQLIFISLLACSCCFYWAWRFAVDPAVKEYFKPAGPTD